MKRPFYTSLGILLVVALVSSVTSSTVVASSPASLAAPANLAMRVPNGNSALTAGGWTAASKVTLQFSVQVSSGTVTPQVEIEPSNVGFKNQANYSGSALSSSGTASVTVDGLTNGTTYHWQAQAVGSGGVSSSWVQFSSGAAMDFGVDQTAPSRPVIKSTTDPRQNHWYHNRVVGLSWASTDSLSGIKGYSFVIRHKAHPQPSGSITTQSSVHLGNLGNGVWHLAVRAIDRAGNWSAPSYFKIQLDRIPLHLTWLGPAGFTFNPYKGPATVRFRVSKSARVHIGLYRVGDKQPTQTFYFAHVPAGRVTTIQWSGRGPHGNPVRAGYYFFDVRAVDRAKNLAHWNAGGFRVNPQQPYRTVTGQFVYPDGGRLIIISLSRQALYAYDGVRLVLSTLVTTGNPSLPTPLGRFNIIAKFSPFEFISPWPPGSPYWYPPSMTNHAMLFQSRGYYIHDAPWRSAYGPGTNGPGEPGSDYGGTHGCVNVPESPMNFLYAWTPVGAPVDVVP